MTNKCSLEASPGMMLYDAFCRECDCYHKQWKTPCECENGKIGVEPFGCKLCDKCNGRGFLHV